MLKTEMRNENTYNIDKMTTYEMLSVINAENAAVTKAVDNALNEIALVCDMVADTIKAGGKVYYIGVTLLSTILMLWNFFS